MHRHVKAVPGRRSKQIDRRGLPDAANYNRNAWKCQGCSGRRSNFLGWRGLPEAVNYDTNAQKWPGMVGSPV